MKIKNTGQTPEGVYDRGGSLVYVYPNSEIDVDLVVFEEDGTTQTRAFSKLLRNQNLQIEGYSSTKPQSPTLGELNTGSEDQPQAALSAEDFERLSNWERDKSSLEDQLLSVQDELTSVKSQLTTLAAEKDELQSKLNDSESKITALTVENEALKSQLEAGGGSSEPEFVPGHLKEVTAGLEASKHKGGGNYSIMVGENEVVTKLTKMQIDEFSTLTTDRQKTDWVNKMVAG